MMDVARPDRRFGAILLSLLVVFAMGAAIYSWQANRQLAGDYAAVTHAYAITNQLEVLMSRITDGETGERGFLITGNENYLEPYVLFTQTVDEFYGNLRALTAENPRQSRQVALLSPLLLARKQELQSIIELRRQNGLDIARASASFDLGKVLHDQIRAIVKTMNDDEWSAIRQRNADVSAATRQSQRGMDLVTLTVAILGGGILVIGWWSRKRGAAGRLAIFAAEADKQRLQAELKRNFELLASVGALAKIGGWEVDVASGVLSWSPEVYKIHEMDPGVKPSVGQALDFYESEGRAQIQGALESTSKNGGSWDFELPFITAKGRRIWVRSIGTVVMHQGAVVTL